MIHLCPAFFSPRVFFLFLVLLLFSNTVSAQDATGIRLNHLGYAPDSPKFFRISNPPSQQFLVQTIDESVSWKTVSSGTLAPEGDHYVGDFSSTVIPADYRILCLPDDSNRSGDTRVSIPIVVQDEPYATTCRLIASSFTWQRCGSPKGWAGLCHQDLVPLVGTDQHLDMRGGYHQSGDLRCWAEGVSLSLYGLIRYAENKHPLWNSGELEEEIQWACEHFLKRVGDDGRVYDCQFVPIGWGPRDFYPSPCNMAGHWNICALLARASVFLRETEPELARKCIAKAEKIWTFVLSDPFFDKPYVPPVGNLPPGTLGSWFYYQTYRGTASMNAAQCGVALDLFRATKNQTYADAAHAAARELMALQFTEGPLKGAFQNDPSSLKKADSAPSDMSPSDSAPSDTVSVSGEPAPSWGPRLFQGNFAFSDGVLNHVLWGPRVFIEMIQAFPNDPEAEQWKKTLKNTLELERNALIATQWNSVPSLQCYPEGMEIPANAFSFDVQANLANATAAWLPTESITDGAGKALLFAMANSVFENSPWKKESQFYIDYCCGGNPREMSCITGAGRRQGYGNIFGQFFPSTPYIPGAVNCAIGGEYDLPSGGMLIWALSE